MFKIVYMDMNDQIGVHELIRALDEERKKVEAFQSELPLCLQLIDQSKIFGETLYMNDQVYRI